MKALVNHYGSGLAAESRHLMGLDSLVNTYGGRIGESCVLAYGNDMVACTLRCYPDLEPRHHDNLSCLAATAGLGLGDWATCR